MLRPALYFGVGFLLLNFIFIYFGNFYAMLIILTMVFVTVISNLFFKNAVKNHHLNHKLRYGTLTILMGMVVSFILISFYIQFNSFSPDFQNPQQTFSVTGVIKAYHPTKTGINYEVKATLSSASLPKRTHNIFVFSNDSTSLKIGEHFSGTITPMPEQKFINTDVGNGVFGRFRAVSALQPIQTNRFAVTRFFAKLKESMIQSIKKILPNKNGDLLIAIILGTTELLDADNKMMLSRSSISHLTAVSGLHVFILCNCFLMIACFFRIPAKTTALLIGLFLLFFISITGFSSSIARAAIMMMIVQVATLVGEKSDPLNALGVSVVFILMVNPYSLLNLGFLLSFSATLSIIIFTKPLEQLLIQNFIASRNASDFYYKLIKSVSSSISVYILLAPVIVYCFGTFPFLAIITNIILAPILPIVVILSFGVAIFSMATIFTPIAMTLGFFVNIALSIILGVASIISNSSIAVVSFHNTTLFTVLVFIFCFIIGMLCLIQIKHRFLLLITTVCLLFGFILFSTVYTNGKSEIVALNESNCVLIKQPDSFFIIGNPTSSYELEQLLNYLKNNYITDVSGFIFSSLDNTTINSIKKISHIANIQNLVNIKEMMKNNTGYLKIQEDITLDISKTNVIKLHLGSYTILKLLSNYALANLQTADVILNDQNILYTQSKKIKYNRYKFVTVLPLH